MKPVDECGDPDPVKGKDRTGEEQQDTATGTESGTGPALCDVAEDVGAVSTSSKEATVVDTVIDFMENVIETANGNSANSDDEMEEADEAARKEQASADKSEDETMGAAAASADELDVTVQAEQSNSDTEDESSSSTSGAGNLLGRFDAAAGAEKDAEGDEASDSAERAASVEEEKRQRRRR